MMPGMTPFAGVSGVFPPSAAPGEDESTKHTQLPTAASEVRFYLFSNTTTQNSKMQYTNICT